jgi:hypothetical protein
MKRKETFLIAIAMTLGSVAGVNAQAKSTTIKPSVRAEQNDDTSPLKPADATPYVFSSEEDRAASVAKKREAIVADIKKNSGNAAKTRELREELWRLDNAIVKKN